MRKVTLFFFLVIIGFVLINTALNVILLLRFKGSFTSERVPSGEVFSCSQRLDYANLLFAKNLKQEAILAFKEYMGECPAKKEERAQLFFRIGSIYMNLGKYERALANFYKAELLDEGLSSELSPRIVEALEKLGYTTQAQYELKKRVSLKEPKESKQARVVARVGEREIRESEIDELLKDIPEEVRNLYGKNNREMFIREFVKEEALFRKAKRLGLDKDPEIRKKIEALTRTILAGSLLKREVSDKIKIKDSELKLYYEAHKEEFARPGRIKVSYVSFEKETRKEEALNRLISQPDKKDLWIEEGDVFIPSIGEAKDVVVNLFSLEKDKISKPFKIKDKFYIFRIEEKAPRTYLDFETVKDRLKPLYKLEKEREAQQEYIKKVMEEEKVEFFLPER